MSNIVEIDNELPILSNDNLIAIAERAEKRIDAVNKIKKVALKVTNFHDWVDQSGKPYLQASGGEKVARLFGISWRIDEPLREDEESGHYTYTYKGYFTMGSITIEAIGTRSSKDGFFKKYNYIDKVKTELPVSEIDKSDVKKSAYTNLIGNGISRLLGIRNLTYDDLKESGIDILKIQKIEYKKEEISQEGKDIKSESHRMMVEMYEDNYSVELEKITSFTGKDGTMVKGKKSLDGLSEKALQVTYAKIKEIYQKGGQEQGTEKKGKNPSITAEQFINILKSAKSEESFDKAWNQYYSENYTAAEKETLLEWRDTKKKNSHE